MFIYYIIFTMVVWYKYICIFMQFLITASAAPTDSDKTAIKQSIADATGASLTQVKNFEVTYATSRRLGEEVCCSLFQYIFFVHAHDVYLGISPSTTTNICGIR
jgi:hypothetical protein